MQLTLRKRTSVRKVSEINVPYYYKIDVKGGWVFGCVTLESLYIVKVIDSHTGLRCEVERLPLESNTVSLEYSENTGELFYVSDETEFQAALRKVISVSTEFASTVIGETGG